MSRRTVFVSYSRKDSTQVAKAVELLEAGGADVFRDLDDIQYGDRWEDVIRTKLAEAERVLVFWSMNAQISEWVEREWMVAISMQKRVVPILLDQTPLPPELGQFHALTNFILPNADSVKAQPSALPDQTKGRSYWLWGGLAGLVMLGAAISFTTLNQHKMQVPPEIVALEPSGTELKTPEDLSIASAPKPAATGSEYPSTVAPMTKPQAPILAPEPEFKNESRNYLAVLSAFLAFFAIIAYLVWKRRQRYNQLQAGEKLVQAIFQE